MAEVEEKIIARLDALGAEASSAILRGEFGDSPSHPVRRVADSWLSNRNAAKRDAREDRTLCIAIWANIIAAIAAIIAITAIVIAKW